MRVLEHAIANPGSRPADFIMKLGLGELAVFKAIQTLQNKGLAYYDLGVVTAADNITPAVLAAEGYGGEQ